MATTPEPGITEPRLDAGVPDYSDSNGDDYQALSRDRIPVRSLRKDDLDGIVALDAKLTGRDRRAYFEAKLREVMSESGVRISLLAEVDGQVAGFIMARVDYGEFGRAESAAVIDTIGVAPAHSHHGVGSALLSQLLANLHVLHVEYVRTRVTWNNFTLLGFLGRNGFAPAQQLVLTKPIDPT
jgi:ribosomal protein S18 acetylase RimI-like enzyme